MSGSVQFKNPCRCNIETDLKNQIQNSSEIRLYIENASESKPCDLFYSGYKRHITANQGHLDLQGKNLGNSLVQSSFIKTY